MMRRVSFMRPVNPTSQVNSTSVVNSGQTKETIMTSKRTLSHILVLAAILGLAAAPAGAVVGTWTLQNNGNWSTAGNWTGGIIPTSAGDTADFSTVAWSGNWTWTIDTTSRTVGTLKMGYTGSNKFTTLAASGGASLIFDNLGSAAQIIIPRNRGDTISAPILLNGSLEIRNNSTENGYLNITGTVTSNSASAKTISNLGTKAGYVQISGNIADGGGGTVAILQSSGSSPLFLGGNNSYTGATTVSLGVLKITSGTALGTTDAGTSVAIGAALQLEGAIITVGAEALSLNGTGVTNTGAMRNIRGTNTYGGLVTLGGATRINSDGGTLTLDVAAGDAVTGAFDLTLGGSGNIVVADPIATGAGTLNKDGVGTLTLAAANTYTGLTTISAGRLTLSGAGTLGTGANALTMGGGSLDLGGTADRTVGAVNITAAPAGGETIRNGSLTGTSYSAGNASGNAIVSANLLASGAAGLAMSGAGTLTLTGTNTYTGGTTVSAGTLIAGGTGSLPGYADSAKIAVGGGATLAARPGAGWSSGQLDTLKDLAGASWAAGSLLGIDTTNGDFAYAGVVGDANAGTNSRGLAKLGANTLTLDQVNTYTGVTAVRGGTLKLQNAGTGLTQTLGGLTLAGPDVTLQSDNAGTGTLSTTFGALTARVAGNTANIVSTGGANVINLTGAAGFIDRGVFFGGANYAALDALNTFVRAYATTDANAITAPAGATIGVNDATKNVFVTGAISAQTTASANTLNLAANSLTFSNAANILSVDGILSAGSGSAAINNTTTASKIQATAAGNEIVIRVDGGTDVLTIAPAIRNFGVDTLGTATALTKSGAGTLTVTGTNTYTGNTTINGGTLELGGGGSLKADTYPGAIYIADGATFNYNSGYNGGAGQNLGGPISGGGSLTVTSTASKGLTLSGDNTGFYGTVTVNADKTLFLNSPAALGNASSLIMVGGINDYAGYIQGSILQVYGTVPAINTPIHMAGTGTISIRPVTGNAHLAVNAPIDGDCNLLLYSGNNIVSYLSLGAKSTYTGNTEISGFNTVGNMYVTLETDDALPTGTVLTLACAGNQYAQVDLNGYDQTLGGLTVRAGGNCIIANTSATPSTLTVNNASDYTYIGNLGSSGANGNFGLTKGGTGILTVSNTNTYTGDTIINGGILEIAGAAKLGSGAYAGNISIASGATFKYNSTAAQTLSGAISGAGRLIKDGTGTLVLSGTNTYGGTTTVNGGTLTLDYTVDTSKLSNSSALVLGGGTLNLSGGTHTEVVASTTLNAGASSVTRTSVGAVLQMGAISPAGGVVNFGAGSIATTTNSNDAGGILGAWATVGGTDWAANDGSGNIVAYTGGYTDIAATGDTITDGAATNVRINSAGTGGNLALSAAAPDTTTVNTLLQNTTTASTIDTAGKTLAVGGIRIGSGMEAVTVGALAGDGTLTAAAAGGVLVLNNGNAAKTLTVNAAIANNTSASALVTAGNVVLNGVNTYTGDTSVGGTLEIGGAGQLGGGAYAGDISIAPGGTFKYNSSAAQTLSGVISGVGGLTKAGAAALSLTGAASTYTGVTNIAAGTLEVSKLADGGQPSSIGASSNGSTNILLANGTTLRYVGAGDSTDRRFQFNGNLAGLSVTLDASGSGPIYFTNTAGPTHSTTNQGPRTLNLIGSNTGDNTLAAVIGNNVNQALSVVKGGEGTWVLLGQSTYTGATTVNAGTLKLADQIAIKSSTLTMGGGTATLVFDSSVASNAFTFGGLASTGTGTGFDIALQNNAGTPAPIALTVGSSNASTTYAGVLSGPGSLIKAGTGTQTLSGQNTYAGTTTVSAGTLVALYPLPGYSDPARVTVAAGATLAAGAGGTGWTSEQLDTLKDLGSASWAASSTLGIDTTNGDFTYASAIGNAGANARNLAKLGANTLTLSNNLAHTGTTTVSGGTLVLSGTNSSATGATTVASGATLRVGAAGNIPTGALTLAGGTLDLIADGGTSFGKNFTVSTGTTTINVDRATGSGDLDGTHTMGNMSIGAQTLNVTGGSGYRLALGAVTLTGAATLNPTTANLRVTSFSGTQNLTLGGTAPDNIVTGAIATSTGTLTKSGTGTWTLNGNNTYTGATTVSAGTLRIGADNVMPDGSAITVSGNAAGVTATLDLNGRNDTTGALTLGGSTATSAAAVMTGTGNLTLNGNVTYANANNPLGATISGKLGLGTAARTFTVNDSTSAAADLTVSAEISGAVGLTKAGTGTLVLAGANTYTGDTTVSAGTLNLADDAQLMFVIGASGASNKITGTGTLSLDGDFNFDLAGAGTTLGNSWTIVDVGTLAETFEDTFSVTSTLGAFAADPGGDKWTKLIPSSSNAYELTESTGMLKVVVGLIPGDANKNGVVDAADYIAVKRYFGMTTGATWEMGNFDPDIDGNVDWDDLQILMAKFGTRSIGGAPPAPEPATLSLLAIGALAVIRRRRK